MPRGIPKDPATRARNQRRWIRYGNIGRLLMARAAIYSIYHNPFYSKRTRYMAETILTELETLLTCVGVENAHNIEDTETG